MKPSYYSTKAKEARNYKWALIVLSIGCAIACFFISGVGLLACACFGLTAAVGAFTENSEASRLALRAKEESNFQSLEQSQRNVAP